jgi:hypothetical protein
MLDEQGKLRRLASSIENDLIGDRDDRREATQQLIGHIISNTMNIHAYKTYLGIFNGEASTPVVADRLWEERTQTQLQQEFAAREAVLVSLENQRLPPDLNLVQELADLSLASGNMKRFRQYLKPAVLAAMAGSKRLTTTVVRAQMIGNVFTGCSFSLIPGDALCVGIAAVLNADFNTAFARLKNFDGLPEPLAGLLTAGEFAAMLGLLYLGSSQPRSGMTISDFRVFEFQTSEVPGADAARAVAALLDAYSEAAIGQCLEMIGDFDLRIQDPCIQMIWPDLRLKISDRLLKELITAHWSVSFDSLAKIFNRDMSGQVLILIESGELADFRLDLENRAVIHLQPQRDFSVVPKSVGHLESEISWTQYYKILRSRAVPELQGKRLRVDEDAEIDGRSE